MRVTADIPPSSRRPRWTLRELTLLALSAALILSPLGALAFALLQPTITIAQTAPDLRVSKLATSLGGIDIAQIAPGGEFYYEIRVQTSSADAVNLTLLDSFPSTVQALTITDRAGGTCTLTANQLSCSLVTSAAREASVLVRTRASTTAPNGTQVTNTVLVTAGATSARGSSALTITGPGNQPTATISEITATTAPPTNTPGPTSPPASTNTAAPANTVAAATPTTEHTTAPTTPTNTAAAATVTVTPSVATTTTSTPTVTPSTPSVATTTSTPTVRADAATATSAALTVVPVATGSATTGATAVATAAATTPTATAEFTVTPSPEATLVSQGTPGPTTPPSTPTGTPEVVAPPPTAIPATVIPTLASPNTDAPTQQPPAPTSVPSAPTTVPPAGGGNNVPPTDGGDVPPPPSDGKEPPATSPDVTGRTLPATSGEQWLWLAPLLGLVLLLHTVRMRRARVH